MSTGIVAIGRNEGDRLRRCLQSVTKPGNVVIYVDSGSTDGSANMARELGAEVVELDMSIPFSAARGRNAGFARLLEVAPASEFVQFVDGDCEIREGWIERAERELAGSPKVAVVCGRRRERFPEASIYNRLCDIEWNTPIGEALSCGGDSMMRVSALRAVDGFDPSAVAGEEPELCRRLRADGWMILRIDAEMTLHDAAMTRFGQWWKRNYRGGYGSMDLYSRFNFDDDPQYARIVRSARTWTVGWATVFLMAAISLLVFQNAASLATVAAILLLLPLQAVRIAANSMGRTTDPTTALAYGTLTMLGKWPQLLGQFSYLRDRIRTNQTRLIEYK